LLRQKAAAQHQRRLPDVMDWYHADDDGTLWMTASLDVSEGGIVRRTYRVDYDGRTVRGGLSPSCLNWDDGVRARDAGIDTLAPEGLHLDVTDPVDAATAAAAWYRRRVPGLPG
jgi:hypothetical protein